jgi:hypothetical protein
MAAPVLKPNQKGAVMHNTHLVSFGVAHVKCRFGNGR